MSLRLIAVGAELASVEVVSKTESIKLTAIADTIFFTAHVSLSWVEWERVRTKWITPLVATLGLVKEE
jgi:hypothetical protein